LANGTAGAPAAAVTIADSLRHRTFRFATQIVLFARSMPPEWYSREMGRQLLRSGTSIGANYRAACRGRSRREFVAKLGVAVEEADETVLARTYRGDGNSWERPLEGLV